MPALAPVIPRQMLPPPTTTAISMPSSARTSTISDASCSSTLPSMPYPSSPAKASPESFSSTRGHRAPSAANDHLSEPHDGGIAEYLLDRLLLVPHELLLEQHGLAEPTVEFAVDDLRQRSFGLSLVARDGFERLALCRDGVRRHFLARDELRLRERRVHRDVVGELLVAALQLDDHRVDAATVLLVQVRVEHVARGGFDAHDVADLDVLLEGDLQVVDLVLE